MTKCNKGQAGGDKIQSFGGSESSFYRLNYIVAMRVEIVKITNGMKYHNY